MSRKDFDRDLHRFLKAVLAISVITGGTSRNAYGATRSAHYTLPRSPSSVGRRSRNPLGYPSQVQILPWALRPRAPAPVVSVLRAPLPMACSVGSRHPWLASRGVSWVHSPESRSGWRRHKWDFRFGRTRLRFASHSLGSYELSGLSRRRARRPPK